MSVDAVLERIRAQLDLDAEMEHELLEELRGHLEDAVAAAQAQGMTEDEALTRAEAAHVGWGAADGVVAAGLPVVCALILRWLVFAPDGTAIGWQEVLVRPAFWAVSLVALLVPMLRFPRWRYALVSWTFFWTLSIVFFALPALRW